MRSARACDTVTDAHDRTTRDERPGSVAGRDELRTGEMWKFELVHLLAARPEQPEHCRRSILRPADGHPDGTPGLVVARRQLHKPPVPTGCEGGEMSPRFAYIYFMRDDPDRVRAAVPKHVSHWRGVELSGYVGGPFADHTGGLITFDADEDRATGRRGERSFPSRGAARRPLAQALGSRVMRSRVSCGFTRTQTASNS